MTISAYNDTFVQPQSQAMGTTVREPQGVKRQCFRPDTLPMKQLSKPLPNAFLKLSALSCEYTLSELPYGKYIVKETKAPTGFILDTNYYSVSIETDGKTYTVENEAGKGFVNSRQKGTLKVHKESEDDIIEGVKFKITGTSLIGEKISLEVQTGADGTVTVPSLLVSNNAGYTITEVDTGIQYVVPQAQNFVINWNRTTEVTFINTFKKGNITLTKVDKEFPTNKLSGAEFNVYKDVNGTESTKLPQIRSTAGFLNLPKAYIPFRTFLSASIL